MQLYLRLATDLKMQLQLRQATDLKMQIQLRQATNQYILIQLRLATESGKQIPIAFSCQQKDFHFNLSCNSGIYSFKNDLNFHCNPDAHLCCITFRRFSSVANFGTFYFPLKIKILAKRERELTTKFAIARNGC